MIWIKKEKKRCQQTVQYRLRINFLDFFKFTNLFIPEFTNIARSLNIYVYNAINTQELKISTEIYIFCCMFIGNENQPFIVILGNQNATDLTQDYVLFPMKRNEVTFFMFLN